MNLRIFLGIALVADVIGIAAVLIAGADAGPLNELALVLAGAVGGAVLPTNSSTAG